MPVRRRRPGNLETENGQDVVMLSEALMIARTARGGILLKTTSGFKLALLSPLSCLSGPLAYSREHKVLGV